MTINEIGSMVPQPPRPMIGGRVMAAQAIAEPVPAESGSQELVFTVSVVFVLK
jgi:uncharacterized protein YggE